MRRALLAAALLLAATLGLIMVFVSPPGQLSLLDAAMGGGIGADRPGDAIAFGTQGRQPGADLLVWRRLGRG